MQNVLSTILSSLNSSSNWQSELREFLESNGTNLLSDEAGSYLVSSLLADLKIRRDSARNSGINVIGINELISSLDGYVGSELIRNYIFKNSEQTGIVYLDENKIVGAILVSSV
ncbi:hypothetical protein [Agarilytica rhodophyticola]|uniref:hypothetical protein n=1 Tax=Agarilytica rhodophyticola TaxID=1737490 RepID=UPI000B34573D|nr:hypothetical protein [Agarilytica rhodophyticola]